jgi:hypothetical protein
MIVQRELSKWDVAWCGMGTGKKARKNRKLDDTAPREEDDGDAAGIQSTRTKEQGIVSYTSTCRTT